MRQQRMENPESRSRFQVTVHGMLASDHDTEKASREKYQRDNKKINFYILEKSQFYYFQYILHIIKVSKDVFGDSLPLSVSNNIFVRKKV